MTSSRIIVTLRRNLQRVGFPVRMMILATAALFVTLTALDLVGVPGEVLVTIGVSIWIVGAVTLVLIWTIPTLGVAVLSLVSVRTAHATRWAIALSTSLVAWTLLLGVIPFEKNPESLIWILAILIVSIGVLAIPRKGGVRAFLVFVLALALALALAAAFGLTPKKAANLAYDNWPRGEPEGMLCVGYPTHNTPDWEAGAYEEALSGGCWGSYIVAPNDGGDTWFVPIGGCVQYRFEDGLRGKDCPGQETTLEPRLFVVQFRAENPEDTGVSVRVTHLAP